MVAGTATPEDKKLYGGLMGNMKIAVMKNKLYLDYIFYY